MKKILVFVNSFRVGGVTSVVKSIYENIDREKFQMDFVSFGPTDDDYVKKVLENGDKVFFVKPPVIGKLPIINYIIRRQAIVKQICSMLKKTKYDVAHIHANAYACLPAAKKLGIPVRITHMHEAIPDFGDNINKSYITKLQWLYRRRVYNKLSTIKAGDSKKACMVKYGEKVLQDKGFRALYPSVDINKFNVNNCDKTEVEKKYNIDASSLNLIHVGRLGYVKNQSFMIDILYQLNKTKKAELYIVGFGSLKEELEAKACSLGVGDRLHFLPPDTPPEIYSAMTCSLLTSFSEAFGMVAVESQMMNVPCFASTNVAQDVDCGICSFIELEKGAKEWASSILNYDYTKEADKNKLERFYISAIIKEVEDLYAKSE